MCSDVLNKREFNKNINSLKSFYLPSSGALNTENSNFFQNKFQGLREGYVNIIDSFILVAKLYMRYSFEKLPTEIGRILFKGFF